MEVSQRITKGWHAGEPSGLSLTLLSEGQVLPKTKVSVLAGFAY